MYTSEVIHDGHIRRLTITRQGEGWEVCEEHDSRVVRTSRYSDWHRVERAKDMFVLQHRLATRSTIRERAQPSTNL